MFKISRVKEENFSVMEKYRNNEEIILIQKPEIIYSVKSAFREDHSRGNCIQA